VREDAAIPNLKVNSRPAESLDVARVITKTGLVTTGIGMVRTVYAWT
jgi:hypothetical protein